MNAPMPPEARDRAYWHPAVWPALSFFGAETVWQVGLLVLGYPPTWIDPTEVEYGASEVMVLELALTGKFKVQHGVDAEFVEHQRRE